eukprot:1353820-Pyramimonas_sp.AAC.2
MWTARATMWTVRPTMWTVRAMMRTVRVDCPDLVDAHLPQPPFPLDQHPLGHIDRFACVHHGKSTFVEHTKNDVFRVDSLILKHTC